MLPELLVVTLLLLLLVSFAMAQLPSNLPGGGALPGQTMGEPYVLPGQRMVFVDWLYIRPGALNWYNEQGTITARKDLKVGPFGANFATQDMPRGIKFCLEQAVKSGPIIQRQAPYEAMQLRPVALLQDGDTYKLWALAVAEDGKQRYCYFESLDGLYWNRPSLGLVEVEGSKENNFIEGLPGPEAMVFLDPGAPAEAKFKSVSLEGMPKADYDAFSAKYPDRWDPRAWRSDVGVAFGLFGATSPDGLHWTELPEPLNIEHADTLSNTGCYDALLGKYVLYTRNWWLAQRATGYPEGQGEPWWVVGRRSIGRTESANFEQFPLSEIVLHSPPDMLPSEVLYTNCYAVFPKAPEARLMFPAIWNMDSDTTRIEIAGSTDGRVWDWLPGGTVLDTGAFGEFDGGCIFPQPNLVELPNGDLALPYAAWSLPHKYPRGLLQLDTAYALWPKGRMMGLEAEQLGEFTTVGFVPPGKKLKINALTKRGGSIQIAACNIGRQPLPGRNFDDCAPLIGDLDNASVRWTGGDDLGLVEGEALILKVKLNQAKLYWFEFE